MKKNLLLLAPMLFPAAAAAQGHYNIVYIMTDDHTAQMMSCYDNRFVETPNLDRIAADGVKFVNSYVANSLSGPAALVCLLANTHTRMALLIMSTACLTVRSKPCPNSCKRLATKPPSLASGTW